MKLYRVVNVCAVARPASIKPTPIVSACRSNSFLMQVFIGQNEVESPGLREDRTLSRFPLNSFSPASDTGSKQLIIAQPRQRLGPSHLPPRRSAPFEFHWHIGTNTLSANYPRPRDSHALSGDPAPSNRKQVAVCISGNPPRLWSGFIGWRFLPTPSTVMGDLFIYFRPPGNSWDL